MNDSGEEILEIDTFRQAVGSDQDALLGLPHRFNRCFTLGGGKFASHWGDQMVAENRAQLLCHVMRSCNVAAEDNRLEAGGSEFLEVFDETLELGVLGCAGQSHGTANQVAQPLGILGAGPRFNVLRGQVVLQAIKNSLPPLLFGFLQRHCLSRALSEHRTREASTKSVDGGGR